MSFVCSVLHTVQSMIQNTQMLAVISVPGWLQIFKKLFLSVHYGQFYNNF